jgi:hypothetical protein
MKIEHFFFADELASSSFTSYEKTHVVICDMCFVDGDQNACSRW